MQNYAAIFFFFFLYIICTVLQCDLPPLTPHSGKTPERDSNPGQAV